MLRLFFDVIACQVTRWWQLLDNEERNDQDHSLGELELSIQWIHAPRAKELAKKKVSLLEIVQRTLGAMMKDDLRVIGELLSCVGPS